MDNPQAPDGTATETAAEGIASAASEAKGTTTSADDKKEAAGEKNDPQTGADKADKEENKKQDGKSENSQDKGKEDRQDKKDDPDSQPITDWSKVDLGLPEDAQLDPELLKSFGAAAVDMGLTKAQAKAAVEWQLNAIRERREAYYNQQEKEIQKAWGKNVQANNNKIIALAARIDRMKGCENFSKALKESGAAFSADMCKGLLAIANLLDEDGITAGEGTGGGDRAETALEGITAALEEARKGA